MDYEIKRSKRKTLAILVHRDQRVSIRAPFSCKDEEIALFFAKHQNWVAKKLEQSQQYPGLPESQYQCSGTAWLLGEAVTIIISEATINRINHEKNQFLLLQKHPEDTDKTRCLVVRWKRNFAEKLYTERLLFWSKQFPSPLPEYHLRLRKMKRQWGNCNHQGVITINSQLVRYPLTCIDYVLVHELTHLKHLHHGKAFYRLLEKVMPDWRQQKTLLSQFSGSL